MKISLGQQIDEVNRELVMREEVYATAVQRGKMRQSVAQYQMQRLVAVRDTLAWLRENESTIKARLAQ